MEEYDEKIRNLSKDEVIRRITEIYHAGYDLDNPSFDIYNQLLACEVLAETEEEERKRNGGVSILTIQPKEEKTTDGTNESVSVSGNVSGSCKSGVKFELNWYKSELIDKLKRCTSKTPRNEIAILLEEIFKSWTSEKEIHWLWFAQTYTPRVLNWVMLATVNKYLQGGIRKTPTAYFFYLLKFRKKRKEFRATNGTR